MIARVILHSLLFKLCNICTIIIEMDLNLPPVDFSSSEGSELNSSSSETGDTSTEGETILRGHNKRAKRSRFVFNFIMLSALKNNSRIMIGCFL